jgi:hypothetical protein
MIFQAAGSFEPVDREALRPDEDVTASLAFPLHYVVLPAPGAYLLELRVDADPSRRQR